MATTRRTRKKTSTSKKPAASRSPSRKKTGAKTGSATSRKSASTQARVRESSTDNKSAAEREKCFVISPFGGWFDRYYDEIYAPAVRAAALDPVRADDLYRPSAIMHDVWGYVRASRVMVADLTGKNPNVFYELGLAHAVGKPVIMLTQDFDDVPFDLRSLRVIQYSVEDPKWGETLQNDITKSIAEILADPKDAILAPFLHQKVDKQPTASPEDKRLLELEQTVASLRTEVSRPRRAGRDTGIEREVDIGPDEARRLIWTLLDAGASPEAVRQHLRSLGPPMSWIGREIDEFLAQRKPPSKRRKSRPESG